MKSTMPTGENIKDFGPPKGWDQEVDGPCGHLWVRVDKYERSNYHISHWRPSKTELDALNAGAVVELSCVGVQPPVSVHVAQGRPMGEPDGFDTR